MELIINSIDLVISYWDLLYRGILNTLLVSFTGTIIGLFIGLVVGAIRYICTNFESNENSFIKFLKKIINFLLGDCNPEESTRNQHLSPDLPCPTMIMKPHM